MQVVLMMAAAAVSAGCGGRVLWVRPRHPAGWLLAAHGTCLGLAAAGAGTGRSGWTLVVDQLLQGGWVFLFCWLALVAYLLPDGHTANRFWRWWVRAGVAGVVVFLVGAAGDRTGFAAAHAGTPAPLPWLPGPASALAGAVGLVLVALLILGSPFAVWNRLRGSRGAERLQLLWLVWGAVPVPVTLATGWVNHFVFADRLEPLFWACLGLAAVTLPLSIAIAILRYRLFDIELILSRTVTYGMLIAGIVGAYALLLFAAGRLFDERTIGGLFAVGVVAIALHPSYAWLRRRIERLVYGLRSDPQVAIRSLARRAEATDSDGLIVALTDAVAAAVRVDRVWVETSGHGGPGRQGAVRVRMVHRNEDVGHLVVETPTGRQFSPADLALLEDLARYAAVLVRSEQLNDALRESRARMVAGREEERRRLRRDLHDGLGPSLAALVLKLNAAQSCTEQAGRDELLREVREEVQAAIAEIRRLVDDLRPPAIDEVGLLGAIRQRAAPLGGQVTYEITGPAHLPNLPAAVEVVAFRIASEALTNVARHSGASHCQVMVAVGEDLELTVSDNGNGAVGTQPGLGWASMHERAAELGGSCTIATRPEGGLVLRAVLPLSSEPGHELKATP